MHFLIISLFVMGLIGCSPSSLDIVEGKVEQFHTMLQDKQYDKIYQSTSDNFKKSTSEKEFVEFMTTAREVDLGDYKKSELKLNNSVFDFTGNNKIVLVYFSEYKLRSVKEKFTFEESSDGFKLLGYDYAGQ